MKIRLLGKLRDVKWTSSFFKYWSSIAAVENGMRALKM
jgi:hypothetical protein